MPLQSYPEFCRALYDAAPAEFNAAVADWAAAHGKVRTSQQPVIHRPRQASRNAIAPCYPIVAARNVRCLRCACRDWLQNMLLFPTGGPAEVCAAVLVDGGHGSRPRAAPQHHHVHAKTAGHVRLAEPAVTLLVPAAQ